MEVPGTKVTRTQWLDKSLETAGVTSLIGKNILIVDEVDDTRTTLEYTVKELQKDLEKQIEDATKHGEEIKPTRFSIFVLHNKDKAKKGKLPSELLEGGTYYAAQTTGDVWICYPWEAT